MDLKSKLDEIVFGTDTPAGKLFDIGLLIVIAISVMIVMLESVAEINQQYGPILRMSELIITTIFTAEYILRLFITLKPLAYVRSFFGLVDLLALLPQYLGLIFGIDHGLLIIRVLRLLRVFRVLKFTRYTKEGHILLEAMKASKQKISVFLFTVVILVLIIGSVMYLIEGENNGFTSIPKSIYWAIVTLTTVGYGDITPQTHLGKLISSFVMILGYGIIAVPTGIVSFEMSAQAGKKNNILECTHCFCEIYRDNATFCYNCGQKLNSH
ncbi:MAG: ion transporter [Bacteriovoracaceae bacterium]|nr:ion transporter [Bacteriovoracaceae bacterium]